MADLCTSRGLQSQKDLEFVCKNQDFACLGFKISFLKKFLDRSVACLRQETHEHVKTIKKCCLEARHDMFFVKIH